MWQQMHPILIYDALFGGTSPPDDLPRVKNVDVLHVGQDLDERRQFVHRLEVVLVWEPPSEMPLVPAAGGEVTGHGTDQDHFGPHILQRRHQFDQSFDVSMHFRNM